MMECSFLNFLSFFIINIGVCVFRPCFVFRHPTGLVRNVFLQPFTYNVWYCIIIVGIVVIGVTSFISNREKRNSGKIRFVILSVTCINTIFPGCLFFLTSISSFFFAFLVFLCITLRIRYIKYYWMYVCVNNTKLWEKRSVQRQPFIDKSFSRTDECEIENACYDESIKEIETKR